MVNLELADREFSPPKYSFISNIAIIEMDLDFYALIYVL